MPRRSLTASEAFDLRQVLHVATLEALLSSRRWEPGELVFQGGTSLHLVHGSPRFSEDLDFVVSSALKLETLSRSVQSRLQGAAWLDGDMEVSVGRVRETTNPNSFLVTLGQEAVIGAVKVKVEFWRAAPELVASLKAVVAPVRLTRGPAAGMQTFVPSEDLSEIHADKVFALAARPYLKARDVFDLYWMAQNKIEPPTAEMMQTRFALYPAMSHEVWLEQANARLSSLSAQLGPVEKDLARWLPSSWPLSTQSVTEMLDVSRKALEAGIACVETLRPDGDNPEDAGPSNRLSPR